MTRAAGLPPLARQCLAEAVGTFALVFAGTGAIVVNASTAGAISHAGVAMVFGLVVMAMIYALGAVSGAHLNPAVTLAFFAAGRLGGRMVVPYVAAQLAGAVLASAAVLLILGRAGNLGATLPAGSAGQSLCLEVLLTAGLMFVILQVSTGPKEIGLMAGIAIGGTVALEAMFAGPISGASMNPARSIAPALVGGDLRALWVYVVGPVAGALLAVPVWRVLRSPGPGSGVEV